MAIFNDPKQVDPNNYCPFGCALVQLDERGYCCHLVGFTGLGKKMECVIFPEAKATDPKTNKVLKDENDKPIMRQLPVFVDGRKIESVEKTDVVVNPVYIQMDNNGSHETKKWVSSRVYRDCTPEQAQEWRARRMSVSLMNEEERELAEAI